MNRLKELRRANNLTQSDLANMLYVSLKTISRWENGESQIKPNIAKELSKRFHVSMGYLLGFTTDPTRYDDEEIHQIKSKNLNHSFIDISGDERYKNQHKFKEIDNTIRISKTFDNDTVILSVSSTKRDYAESRKKSKKRFIDFINRNVFLLSDFEIDAIFNLILDMDLGNPNTEKHAQLFNKFMHTSLDDLKKQGYSELVNFTEKVTSSSKKDSTDNPLEDNT